MLGTAGNLMGSDSGMPDRRSHSMPANHNNINKDRGFSRCTTTMTSTSCDEKTTTCQCHHSNHKTCGAPAEILGRVFHRRLPSLLRRLRFRQQAGLDLLRQFPSSQVIETSCPAQIRSNVVDRTRFLTNVLNKGNGLRVCKAWT